MLPWQIDNPPLEKRPFLFVEIQCMDTILSARIARELSERVNKLIGPGTSKGASYEDSLFCKALSVVRSYTEIKSNINTYAWIETAKEQQVREEFMVNNRGLKVFFKGESYMINLMNVSEILWCRSRPINYMIKKIGLYPDYIAYIRPNFAAFKKRRKELAYPGRRVEDSMFGSGLEKRDKRSLKAIAEINKRYGTPSCVIDTEDNPVNIENILQKILENLIESGIIKVRE